MFLVVLLIVVVLLVLFSNNSKTVEKYDSCDEPSSQATDNATTQDDKDDISKGILGETLLHSNTEEPFDNSNTEDNDVEFNSGNLLPNEDNGPTNMDEIITAEVMTSNPTCTYNKTLNRLSYSLRSAFLPGEESGPLIHQSSELPTSHSCNNIDMNLLKPLC